MIVDWLWWLFCLLSSLIAFLIARLVTCLRHPKILNIESLFFMPYCICPKCNEQQLHWIAEPDRMTAWSTRKRYDDECKQWERERYQHQRQGTAETFLAQSSPPKLTPKIVLAMAIDKGNVDVIRTCRNCGHEWGQRIGMVSTDVA